MMGDDSMFNRTLFFYELKRSIKLLLILGAVMTMYIVIIINMYDPQMMKTLDSFSKMMPDLMASVGMNTGTHTLLGFMVSYLYGFILLLFPMLFSILRANSLIAKYTDNGAMALLLTGGHKRKTIVITQLAVLLLGVSLLIGYTTVLELIYARHQFPHSLDTMALLKLNLGLLFLHYFIASICFFFSCIFQDTKYSLGFGAGIPIFMYVLQMLANVGGKAEDAKYFTFFTLFDANGIITNKAHGLPSSFLLLAGVIILCIVSCIIFVKKDIYV